MRVSARLVISGVGVTPTPACHRSTLKKYGTAAYSLLILTGNIDRERRTVSVTLAVSPN